MDAASPVNEMNTISNNIEQTTTTDSEPSTSTHTIEKSVIDQNETQIDSDQNKLIEAKSSHLNLFNSPPHSLSSECDQMSEKNVEKKFLRKIKYYLTDIIQFFVEFEDCPVHDFSEISGNNNKTATNPCTSHNNVTTNKEKGKQNDEISTQNNISDNNSTEIVDNSSKNDVSNSIEAQ